MSVRLRIRTGGLAGRGFEFDRGPVRVGRNPGLELGFDAERDAGVSGLHAEFVQVDGRWCIRDLGSRNGTFVNGARIAPTGPTAAATELGDGDVVTFGPGGPEVHVGIPGGTLGRIRAAARQQTRRLQLGLIGVSAALFLVLVAFAVVHLERQAGFATERDRLVAEADSLLSAVRGGGRDDPASEGATAAPASGPEPEAADPTREARMAGEVAALSEALRRSEAELVEIRDALVRSSGNSDSAGEDGRADLSNEALRNQLQAATAALRRHQMAGSIDLDAIEAGNRGAVALVFVESAAGEVVTGTAFAVRPDGTLVTVRHLIDPDADGTPPRRIAVQFSDSDQVWPAQFVSVSTEFDLAAIRVRNIVGPVPVVRGMNTRPDTLGSGVPVASLGFPLGGVEGATRARPLATVGVLGTLRPDRVEVFGYGEVGASGSPLFDGAGEVVGVLFGGVDGGLDGGGERTLLAVNSVQVVRFLARLPSSP